MPCIHEFFVPNPLAPGAWHLGSFFTAPGRTFILTRPKLFRVSLYAAVSTPKREMGAVAGPMLIEHVESPDVLPPRRATFDAHLVVRASVQSLAEEGGREPAATAVSLQAGA